MATKRKQKRGRPSVIDWTHITPQMWGDYTDTEMAIHLGTSQPNVRFHRAKLIKAGREYAEYVRGKNANRQVRKEKFCTPYRTHEGGAYSMGVKLTTALKIKE